MSAAPLRLAVDGRVLDDRYHGIGRITAALLTTFSSDPSLEVTVFTHPAQVSERFDITELVEGRGMRRASFPVGLTSPRQYLLWPRALAAADAEWAFFPYHLGAPAWGRVGRSVVVHDCILETRADFAPDRLTSVLYQAVTRVVVQRARVLAPSEATAQVLSRRYPGPATGRTLVAPWAVDSSFAAVPGAGVAPARADGQPFPARYVLHVGARRPHKNVEVLVRTLHLLGPDEHLVLVGSPDDRWPDPVPGLVRDLGLGERVLHLPSVSEAQLRALYAGAHAFVYPSLVEGFGLPLLEAMAAGAPVVASDIPVFREVGGTSALWADPTDPASWAQALRALDRPGAREELVAAGRARAAAADWARAGAAVAASFPRRGPVRTATPAARRTAGGPRVAVMGDSVAAGLGVRGRSYGHLLAEDLGASAVRVLARSEATVLDACANLPVLRAFSPDVVVVSVGGSDALVHVGAPVQRLLSRWGPRSWRGTAGLEPRAVFSGRLSTRWRQRAGTAAKLAVKHVGIRLTGGYRRVEPDVFDAAFSELLDELDGLGVPVVVVEPCTVDELYFPGSDASGAIYRAAARRRLRDHPALLHVTTLDLLERWADFLPDHAHLSPRGHRKVADRILSTLDEAGLLPLTTRSQASQHPSPSRPLEVAT